LRGVGELFVAILTFAKAGNIEFVFGNIHTDDNLGHDGKLR
jgi:hypothetical protein